MEITAKHIVTGSIRLIHVIFYSFLLAYGMALGSYLYDAFHPDAPSDGYCPDDDALLPPEWVNIPLFPIMAAGISMTFGSAPHQWISEILCAALGYCVTFFLGPLISDTSILNAISAFVVGLYAHLALKVTGEPPISPISVGLTLLVPGSIGKSGGYKRAAVRGALTVFCFRRKGRLCLASSKGSCKAGLCSPDAEYRHRAICRAFCFGHGGVSFRKTSISLYLYVN